MEDKFIGIIPGGTKGGSESSETVLVSIETELKDVNSALATLDIGLDNVNSALATVNTKLDDVNSALATVNTKLDDVNSALATLETTSNAIESLLAPSVDSVAKVSVDSSAATVTLTSGDAIGAEIHNVGSEIIYFRDATAIADTDDYELGAWERAGYLKGTISVVCGANKTSTLKIIKVKA